jgi:prepilin-type N-terminal cleavage/methylation domain-containing protein
MSTRGFSLLELTVVLLAFGAMMSIALPALSASRTRMSVRHAADEFRAAHALARSMAIRQGRVAALHIDGAGNRYWVEVDTTLARTGVTDTIGVVRDFSNEGIAMTSTRSVLCFDSRGLATQTGACSPHDATVVFSRAAYADSVRISALGKVLR